jgi:dienelactone hydrolase
MRDGRGCAVPPRPGADRRSAGVRRHTPDLFDGRTFDTIDDGLAFAREAGFGALAERGVAAAEGIRPEAVYAGFSFGVMVAQQLAQTRPGARGALLMYSCLPVSEFGDAWPEDVPAQVHGKDADPFFLEDLEAAQALVDSTDRAELFLYPGEEHLFADSSLPASPSACWPSSPRSHEAGSVSDPHRPRSSGSVLVREGAGRTPPGSTLYPTTARRTGRLAIHLDRVENPATADGLTRGCQPAATTPPNSNLVPHEP